MQNKKKKKKKKTQIMINLKKLIFLSIKLLNSIILPIVLLKRYNLVEFIRRKKRKNKIGFKILKIV